MRGFVYVLTNSSYPRLVKIGKTSRSPEQRATELSGTGVPTPFVVSYSIEVDDMDSFEQHLHDHFSEFRYNKDREFFEIQSKTVVDKIIESAKLFTFSEGLDNSRVAPDQVEPLNFYIALVEKLSGRESVYRFGYTTLLEPDLISDGIEEYMREISSYGGDIRVHTIFQVKEKLNIPMRLRLVFSELFIDEENQLFEADLRTLERVTGYLRSEFWDNDRILENKMRIDQELKDQTLHKSVENIRRQQLKNKI